MDLSLRVLSSERTVQKPLLKSRENNENRVRACVSCARWSAQKLPGQRKTEGQCRAGPPHSGKSKPKSYQNPCFKRIFEIGSFSLRDSIGVVITYDNPFPLKRRTLRKTILRSQNKIPPEKVFLRENGIPPTRQNCHSITGTGVSCYRGQILLQEENFMF